MDSDATQLVPEPQSPSLPTEIIHRIIQLALPRVSLKTFRQRYDTLLGFMLVDQRWKELAQSELLRHVLLKTEQQVDLFSEVISNALSICTHIEMISILATETSAAVLDLETLAEGVQEIRLDGCSFLRTPSLNFAARNLRRITLSYLPRPEDYVTILFLDLPSLDELALFVETDELDAEDFRPMLQQVERLAPRLRTFSYATLAGDAADSLLPESLWRLFHVLEKLSIDHDMPIPDALPRLPALHTLQVREAISTDFDPRPITLKGVKEALESGLIGLRSLRRLGLPALDDAEPAEVATRRGISEWCESRMVELYEASGHTHDDFSGILEDALNFCELFRSASANRY